MNRAFGLIGFRDSFPVKNISDFPTEITSYPASFNAFNTVLPYGFKA